MKKINLISIFNNQDFKELYLSLIFKAIRSLLRVNEKKKQKTKNLIENIWCESFTLINHFCNNTTTLYGFFSSLVMFSLENDIGYEFLLKRKQTYTHCMKLRKISNYRNIIMVLYCSYDKNIKCILFFFVVAFFLMNKRKQSEKFSNKKINTWLFNNTVLYF